MFYYTESSSMAKIFLGTCVIPAPLLQLLYPTDDRSDSSAPFLLCLFLLLECVRENLPHKGLEGCPLGLTIVIYRHIFDASCRWPPVGLAENDDIENKRVGLG